MAKGEAPYEAVLKGKSKDVGSIVASRAMQAGLSKAIRVITVVVLGFTPALAVIPNPAITDLNIEGDHLSIDVASVSNHMVTVEKTDQLTSNNGKSITTLYATNENTVVDDYPFVGKSEGFYRGRIDPLSAATNRLYHSWPTALYISNGLVEAMIVPAVGRIMQFGFFGAGELGVFYQNRELDGESPNASKMSYKFFGGDKTWPAPQSDWSAIIGQDSDWPPPTHFEVMTPYISENGAEVLMKSAVDPFYGIQVSRRIRLLPGEPRMHVTTTFEQITSITNQVSVWVVSLFNNPERIFVPVAENSIFTNGYHVMNEPPPLDLVVSNNLISFSNNTQHSKIGSDSDRLLGLGAAVSLEVSAPRIPHVVYPDSGSSVEVFTEANRNYVELELLGPLTQLLPGQSISLEMNYTLHERVLSDPQLEAERIFNSGL